MSDFIEGLIVGLLEGFLVTMALLLIILLGLERKCKKESTNHDCLIYKEKVRSFLGEEESDTCSNEFKDFFEMYEKKHATAINAFMKKNECDRMLKIFLHQLKQSDDNKYRADTNEKANRLGQSTSVLLIAVTFIFTISNWETILEVRNWPFWVLDGMIIMWAIYVACQHRFKKRFNPPNKEGTKPNSIFNMNR